MYVHSLLMKGSLVLATVMFSSQQFTLHSNPSPFLVLSINLIFVHELRDVFNGQRENNCRILFRGDGIESL